MSYKPIKHAPPPIDGVFLNMSAKPVSDLPPSYDSIVSSDPPHYIDNTFFTSISPGEFDEEILFDGLPLGTFFSFLFSFSCSVFFQFVGFFFAYLLSLSHAGRFGAKAGFGFTLFQLGLILYEHELTYLFLVLGSFIFFKALYDYFRLRKLSNSVYCSV